MTLLSKLRAVRRILQRGWSKRTSYDPDNYDSEERSYGQCYVTARALNHVFGWTILHTRKDGANHYWNVLPDGTEIDFTSDQMGGDGIFLIQTMRGSGRRREFKHLSVVKSCNLRLKRFLETVEEPLRKVPIERVHIAARKERSLDKFLFKPDI